MSNLNQTKLPSDNDHTKRTNASKGSGVPPTPVNILTEKSDWLTILRPINLVCCGLIDIKTSLIVIKNAH